MVDMLAGLEAGGDGVKGEKNGITDPVSQRRDDCYFDWVRGKVLDCLKSCSDYVIIKI